MGSKIINKNVRGTSYQPPGGHVYYILEPARAADEPKLTASGKWHHKENRIVILTGKTLVVYKCRSCGHERTEC